MGSSLPSVSREGNEVVSGVNSTTLSGGILSAGFHGSLYTCMHCMEAEEKLVAGTGNGYLRFIDINAGCKLHLWRCEPLETSFSSLISAIWCSGHRDNLESKKGLSNSTWIAAGLSSGHCRLLDLKSGTIITHWRAHDGFVTKLAALDEHLLISSSLDRTLRLWDLRRIRPTQLQVFRGHSDEVCAIANVLVDSFFIVYVLTPIVYWNNVYDAKTFPIISSGVFLKTGHNYNTLQLLTSQFTFDEASYTYYGKQHLSAFFASTYGVGFGALSATVSHVLFFHGKDI